MQDHYLPANGFFGSGFKEKHLLKCSSIDLLALTTASESTKGEEGGGLETHLIKVTFEAILGWMLFNFDTDCSNTVGSNANSTRNYSRLVFGVGFFFSSLMEHSE